MWGTSRPARSHGGGPGAGLLTPSTSDPGAQPGEVVAVLVGAAGRLADHGRARVADDGREQVGIDLPGPEAGVPVGAGVEVVAAVVGVDQVDPAGDPQDVLDDRLQRVATGVGVAGVEAE